MTVQWGSQGPHSDDKPTMPAAIPGIVKYGCYTVLISSYMLVSLVAPFFPRKADDWGLTQAEIGFVVGCDPIGEIFAAAVAGFLLATFGPCRAAVGGVALNGVSSVLFGVAPMVTTSHNLLMVIFVLMRLSNGLATTVTYVALFTVLCQLQPGQSGMVTSHLTVLTSVGVMVGPLFGGLLDSLGHWIVTEFQVDDTWQFATPFIVNSLLLVGPALVLLKAEAILKGMDEDGKQEEEEEEEVSFVEELRRMGSVLNPSVGAVAFGLATCQAMQNAPYAVLANHLEPRCTQNNAMEGDHQPFGFSEQESSLFFSVSSITFLPLSLYMGIAADKKSRDFPWLRRWMAVGLLLNVVGYFFMGPIPVFGQAIQRTLETPSAMVLAQCILGISTSITAIVAFPFLEGLCELPREGQKTFTTEQRLVIAGTWYNTAYSLGCAFGSMFAGWVNGMVNFYTTLGIVASLNLVAVAVLVAEGELVSGPHGGFWGRARGKNWIVGDGAGQRNNKLKTISGVGLNDDMLDGLLQSTVASTVPGSHSASPSIWDYDYISLVSPRGSAPAAAAEAAGGLRRSELAQPALAKDLEVETQESADEEEQDGYSWWWAPHFCTVVIIVVSFAVLFQAVAMHSRCGDFYATEACAQGQPTPTGEMGVEEILGLFDDATMCQQVQDGLEIGLAIDSKRGPGGYGKFLNSSCEVMRNATCLNATCTNCNFVAHAVGNECLC